MSTETLVAYMASIALATALIVQLVKVGLIDPHTKDSPARDALIRGLSYALNLGFLLGFLALNNQLDGSQALLYLSLALGQAGVSHGAYSVLSGGSTVAQPAPSDPASSSPVSDTGGGA